MGRSRARARAGGKKERGSLNRSFLSFCRCHRPRDSLFSWSSGFDNFTGFVNWGFLLLSIGGIRLLLENFIKYGIRVDPRQWFLFLSGRSNGSEEYPSLLLIFCKCETADMSFYIRRAKTELSMFVVSITT
ncbi:Diacylglycerol O-acyltransferase 1 [Harpegnathos saltator]|uniref:diacylglycerol O-acyltransferase n=1 Tax=Harpegnathos saltator TaxID=610380 RepID=E2BFP3_HARSA|nr:Diacylglycerol O-acyltransferase 1 [Harpegnathos saltator]